MMRMTNKKSPGQILVIFGISLLALLFFVGFALDAGSLYITYGHLKRAVDSAAIAAANEYKRGANTTDMGFTAAEVLTMMNTDMNGVDLSVYICDENDNTVYTNTGVLDGHPDGKRDENLATLEPVFYSLCPNYLANEAAKKLVWVQATQKAPLYFLSLLGFSNIGLQTHTISEAAPLDLVIVLDVSESMGNGVDTVGSSSEPNTPNTGSPATTGCNIMSTCEPLQAAKNAAKALVNTMYDAVDQVAIVTYSNVGVPHLIYNKAGNQVFLSDDMSNVLDTIDAIKLNDDAPVYKIWYDWYMLSAAGEQVFNMSNPEDRDNDGLDADNDLVLYGVNCPWPGNPADDQYGPLADRFWTEAEGAPAALFAPGGDFEGWGGVPCDRDDYYDAYDWVDNGEGPWVWTLADDAAADAYLLANDPIPGDPLYNATFAPLSTCIGCGIRTGANILKGGGRYGSVWVMVFLTDGQANLGDTPITNPDIVNPSAYPNGFCNSVLGGPNDGLWALGVACKDESWTPRICIDADGATCPVAPGAADWTMGSYLGSFDARYTALDYARDMTDEAALQIPNNPNEPAGDDIAVYSIGLGNIGDISTKLLRYMALIGIEGRRDTTDPCAGKTNATWCGQYYYASGGADLTPIFEDIASRIFTRISQ